MDKLKYRMREKWMDKLKYRMRERERERLSAVSMPKSRNICNNQGSVRLKSGTWDPLSLPKWRQESKYWETICFLTGCIGRKLSQKWCRSCLNLYSGMGCNTMLNPKVFKFKMIIEYSSKDEHLYETWEWSRLQTIPKGHLTLVNAFH